MWWKDSFVNFLTSIGMPGRDRVLSQEYMVNEMQAPQLIAAYRANWIARKCVDIPADDMTREWRSWQADKDTITKIEECERNFNIQSKLREALTKARLYGGSAILLGTDDSTDMNKPLDLEKIGEGSLKWLHVVTRYEVNHGGLIYDIASPWYGEPEWYERNRASNNKGIVEPGIKIHPSRVVRFIGVDRPDRLEINEAWGDSVLQAVDDAIKSAGLVTSSLAHLISDAKVDVIKVPNLTQMMINKASKDLLTERFMYANAHKGIINAIVLDKEEEWERVTANFAGMPDVLEIFMQVVSGAVDIPAVRFLSQSPKGLNATGESDVRNYYDRLAGDQETRLTPTIRPIDEIVLRHVTGKRDPALFYEWNPLWQLNDKETSDIALNKAQVAKIDSELGLIPFTALAVSRQNQLIEDGTYPGLEDAIADAEAAGETIEPPPSPLEMIEATAQAKALNAPPEQKRLPAPARDHYTKDMAPMPLYVRRDVLNGEEIIAWARAQGFKSTLPASDMHVTITYSRMPVDWFKVGGDNWNTGDNEKGHVEIKPGGPRAVQKFGEAIVLQFGSTTLQWRHEAMKREGASWDHGDYNPHVTITYSGAPEGEQYEDIEPYRGRILLGPEIFEPIEQGDGRGEGYEEIPTRKIAA